MIASMSQVDWLTGLERAIDGRISSLGTTGESVVRLGLAAALGGLVGLEARSRDTRQVSARSCLSPPGRALAMVVSLSLQE